jgi:integration host factor subunit beta
VKKEDAVNKMELVEALAKENRLSKAQARKAVELFFDEMAGTLAKGERVEIRGLCSISVKEYGAYTGRNPKTGEITHVSPKKLPFFKCGKELKERVDR